MTETAERADDATRLPASQRLWWLPVAGIYVASRILTTVLMLLFARGQVQSDWSSPHPIYRVFANFWDGRWYQIIAEFGYPTTLTSTDGHLDENAWAFMPVYPFLTRLLMTITNAPWEVAGITISFAAGLGSAYLLYRLLHPRLGHGRSLFAVAVFCAGPTSPLFQVTYAESLGYFLLLLVLVLWTEKRWIALLPAMLFLAFTRPAGLALAAAFAIALIARIVKRRTIPLPRREGVWLGALTVYAGLLGLAWPAIAWWVTGVPKAYTDTELAWRAGYIGYGGLVPFAAWFQGAHWWLSHLGFGGTAASVWGTIATIVIMLGFASLFLIPAVRRLGLVTCAWLAGYGIYILAVFFPQSSTFRILSPMFPLAGALAAPRRWWYRVLVLAACVAGQVAWLTWMWQIVPPDWTPP